MAIRVFSLLASTARGIRRRPGVLASLRPRAGVPRQARGAFAVAVPCLFAVWALSGQFLSLGPSLAAQVTGSRDLLWGGLVVFLLAGLAVTFAAITAAAAAAFLAGTAVAGVGFGLALLGANRSLIPLAAPGQRAGLIAAIFIINYLGLGIPVVIAGVATGHFITGCCFECPLTFGRSSVERSP